MFDSNGNTWHCVQDYPPQFGSGHNAILYAWDHAGSPLSVGPGHTVSVSGAGSFAHPVLAMCAFSGTGTSADPIETHNGAGGSGNLPLSTGGISPIAGNLIVTGFADSHNATASVDTGMTIGSQAGASTGSERAATLAYKLVAPGGAQNPTWTGSVLGGGSGQATSIASFSAGAQCTISTGSLPGGVIGTAYNRTLTTSNCTSPTFGLLSGSFPAGIAMNNATGVISGTPSSYQGTNLTFNAMIQVTDGGSNGSSAKGLSIVGSLPALPAGNPVVTSISYTGYANSICATYTTDTYSQITLQSSAAGGASGGPYNVYSTGVLFPVNRFGSGSNGYGTLGATTTCLVVPTSSATYYARLLADNDHSLNGGAQTVTAATAVTTAAPTVTTQMAVSTNPAVYRINDQFNGLNGVTNTGKGVSGDTNYVTKLQGNNGWIGQGEDCWGTYNGSTWVAGNGSGICVHKWPTADMLNPVGVAGYTLQGPLSCRSTPIAAIATGGWTYFSEWLFACNHNIGPNPANRSDVLMHWIKSADGFTTSIRPQDNVDQFSLARPGVVTPTIAVVTGTPTVAGTTVTIATTANIPVNTRIQVFGITCVTGVVNTMGLETGIVTASSAGSMSYSISTATNGDTCSTSVDSYVMAAMSNLTMLLQWIQCGNSDYDNCPHVAGLDAFVYAMITLGAQPAAIANGNYLVRIRKEDLALQDYNKIGVYKGTRTGADGILETGGTNTVWDYSINKFVNGLVFTGPPYIFAGGGCNKPQGNFIPGVNRFLLACNVDPYGGNYSGGLPLYDQLYPWSATNFAGNIYRNVTAFPYWAGPIFTNVLPGSCVTQSTTPLSVYCQVVESGGAFFNQGQATTNPGTEFYSTWMQYIAIGPYVPAIPSGRPRIGYGARQIPSNGLIRAYLHRDTPGSAVMVDETGNGNVVIVNGNIVNTDAIGFYGLAAPTQDFSYPTWVGLLNQAYSTGMSTALGDFTYAWCGGSIPAAAIKTRVSGEIIASAGTDFKIARHLLTDTWDVTVKNVVVGALPLTDNAAGCFIIRRGTIGGVANTVEGYVSSALGAVLPLTPTIPGVVRAGVWSGATLNIGDATTAAHVIHSTNLLWNLSLSDIDMQRLRAALGSIMTERGVAIP